MVRYYYSLSFQTRIQFTFILLIILAVSLTGGGAYWVASDIVESNAAKLGQDTTNKSTDVLDEQLRHIAVSVMTLMISDAYHDMIRDASLGDASNYYTHLTSMQPLFAQVKLNEPMTQSILISTPIGDFYDTGYIRNSSVPFVNSEIQHKLKEVKTNLWIPGHIDTFFSGGQRVITFAMEPITAVDDVYIIVNVLESTIEDTMKANLSSSQDDMVLVSSDGSQVIHSSGVWNEIGKNTILFPEGDHSNSGHLLVANHDNDYILTYSRLSKNIGWTLVNMKERSGLLKELKRIKWIMFSVAAGCTFIALLFSSALMALLINPLHNLRKLMKRVENNDLTVRFNSKYSDEISRVGEHFNRMLEQISMLIATNQKIETEKRKEEVKALQAQISPHFLYNTLNTIYWRNQMGQSEDVGEMVLSLSRMFRLGLNGGNEMTTIDKELTHVEQYLMLQLRSYEELFTYEIEVGNEALRSETMLKLMLQPLVENSILHGFKNKREKGRIRIHVIRQGDTLEISVSDNGKGMDLQSVYNILSSDQNEANRDGGYALRNIYKRLQLYYGVKSTMTIQSNPDLETKVILTFPLHVH